MNFILGFYQPLATSDWIQIIIAILSFIGIVTSIVIAVSTLKQNSRMIKENTRAYIVLYIDYHPQTNRYFLVIKNFGKSIGKLISIDVSPKLDWKRCKFKQNIKPLTESKNVLLAPGQKISSWFDFEKYPDKFFNVKLTYQTLNKDYTEMYTIDLNWLDNKDWIHNYSFDDQSDDYKEILYRINNSILEVSDNLK